MLPRAFERAVKSQEGILPSAEGWSSLRWACGGLAVVFWIWDYLITVWVIRVSGSELCWWPLRPLGIPQFQNAAGKILTQKVERIKSAATEAISTTSCLFINCVRCVLPLFWKWRPPGNPYAKWHCQFMAFQPWTHVHSHQAPSTLDSYQYPGMCFKLVPEGGMGLTRAPHAQLGWTFFLCFLLKLYITRRVWKSH